jgi:hypothetical protein
MKPVRLLQNLAATVALTWLGTLVFAAEPELSADAFIPRKCLALWLNADGAALENGEITVLRDHSGRNNDAFRQKDPKIAAGNPTVVKHEGSGRSVLRFDGRFVGYEFDSIKNARTVIFVVSKHPTAYKKFAERFVLGGREKTSVDYHVGCHWTDTIIELGMFKHGKVWFNGHPIDPALSEFSPKLAVITFVAGRDTIAEQLARDRDFVDRSWHGNIAELLIYTEPLADADRNAAENYLLKKYAITPVKPVTVLRESVLPGHTKPPTENRN